MDRTVDGFLLRELLTWERLRRALSRLTGRPESEIAVLAASGPADLAVEVYCHDTGFRTDVTLYKLDDAHVPLRFAAAVAAELGCAVLHTPDPEMAAPPSVWALFEPEGRWFLVHQLDPDADDIEVDLRSAREMPALQP